MSQKKISSFFKTSTASKVVKEEPPKAVKEEPPAADATSSPEKDVNGHDASPVKAPTRRRIRMITDSDEEEETDQKKAVPEKNEELAIRSSSKSSLPPAKSEEPVRGKRRTEEMNQRKAVPDRNEELAIPSSSKASPPPVESEEPIAAKRKTARKSAKRSPEPNQLSTESDAKRVKTEPTSEKEPSSQPSSPAENKKVKTEPPASPKQEEMETDSKPESDEKVEVKKERGRKEKGEKEEKGKKKNVDNKKATKASPPVKKEVKEEKPSAMSKSSPPKDEKAKEKPKAEKKLQNFAFTTSGKSDQKSSATSQVCDYNPDKANYDPVEDACWKKGAKVPYLALAITLDKIDGISGRLRIIEVLSNFLRSVLTLSPDDLLSAVYLCLNKIAPDYEGLELGIGESLLVKALAEATGRTPDKVRAEAAAKGDLGLVAESSRSQQRVLFPPPPLMLSHVFTKLRTIAEMTGNSVQQKKVDIIKVLLVACRQCEARFLVRSLGGKLRVGLAEASLLTALAHAAALSPPHGDPKASKKRLEEAALLLKTAYCECPDYERIINALLEEGVDSLPERCRLSPGIPLKPMLAHPTKAISEVLNRFEGSAFTCEFKYDGERAQIHLLEDGSVRIYSRNQEDNTGKYPEVVSRIRAAISPNTKTCILDSEAVAWDRPSQTILPFQTLSTRKRKETTEEEVKVQVCVFAFDLLYHNGESLVKEPLRKRRELLRETLVEVPGETQLARSADLSTVEDIQEFLQESIKGSCEGLMVKSLDAGATYEIAKRSHNWLKLKKDYLDGVGDSVDAVVLGGYHGKGKRTGTFGCFLLGCYDPDNEEFQTLCKIGTGFSEEQLDQHSSFFKEHIIPAPKSYYRFDSSLAPDAWFEPCQVWEIKSADLSVSPVHKAALGLVDPEKGISLRFPRFIRIRDDKNPEDATSAQQVADLYNKQDHIKNKKAAVQETTADEDFY
ncbi:DNA ligase 1 [Rhipicephalus microplus]|uniref:DNA ligase 1 n=1 Tax=Rhipicephalus microplus TaxID=6941 RepID=UPI003F6ADE1E